MATNFPTSQDSLTNPTGSDLMSSAGVDHAAQHTNANDAIEAIEGALLDGAPVHIDDANERLGIGTTSPVDPLHVVGDVTIESEDGGSAAAPEVSLLRDSASPADGDYLGQLRYVGKNDTGGEVVYAKITGKASDVTNGTEDGVLEIAQQTGGSQRISARFTNNSLDLLNSTSLSVDGNITVTGTVDGRDVATDGTKLDGIAAGAEVNAVDAVNGQTGYVNLNADHIGTFGTTNKFVTSADLTTLSNTSGTNTGDQSAASILTDLKTVDGSGSGLDADTVDGIEGNNFLRSDTGDSASGSIYFAGGMTLAYGQTFWCDGDIRGFGDAIHVDASTQRVGIDKLNPAYTLDVSGDINYTGTFRQNGTALSFGGGTELISTTTIGTGVTSVTVSNCFSSSYDSYRVQITEGGSTVLTNINVRLNSITSGYRFATKWINYTGSTGSNYASSSSSYWYGCGQAGGTSSTNTGDMVIQNPYASERTTVAWIYTGENVVYWGGGRTDATTSATGLVFTIGSGSFQGGNIRVYGYKNS